MEKYLEKMGKYLGKHPNFLAKITFTAGLGCGFLLTYPVVREHPVRWGVSMLALAALGLVYAANAKK